MNDEKLNEHKCKKDKQQSNDRNTQKKNRKKTKGHQLRLTKQRKKVV